jgi:dipeptide/tripeptide permease
MAQVNDDQRNENALMIFWTGCRYTESKVSAQAATRSNKNLFRFNDQKLKIQNMNSITIVEVTGSEIYI